MAAHKYWTASAMFPLPGMNNPIELSEFQLFNGATRLDTSATLTGTVPDSGSLATLKDDLTSAGLIWTDGSAVALTWTFPTAVDVDGVLLGARTTAARFPTCGALVGSDTAAKTGLCTVRGFGGMKFVSAAKTPVVRLSNPVLLPRSIVTTKDYSSEGGRGLIAGTVKTTPDAPTFARVRLIRERDGKVLRETWSDPVTGAYTFDNFDENFTYTVLSYHPQGEFRAVVADGQVPGLMP